MVLLTEKKYLKWKTGQAFTIPLEKLVHLKLISVCRKGNVAKNVETVCFAKSILRSNSKHLEYVGNHFSIFFEQSSRDDAEEEEEPDSSVRHKLLAAILRVVNLQSHYLTCDVKADKTDRCVIRPSLQMHKTAVVGF